MVQDERGPPTTIVHLFDYPYEDIIQDVSSFFAEFGVVKGVRYQNYLRNGDTWCIGTGTRLVDIVLSQTSPSMAIINGSTISNLSHRNLNIVADSPTGWLTCTEQRGLPHVEAGHCPQGLTIGLGI